MPSRKIRTWIWVTDLIHSQICPAHSTDSLRQTWVWAYYNGTSDTLFIPVMSRAPNPTVGRLLIAAWWCAVLWCFEIWRCDLFQMQVWCPGKSCLIWIPLKLELTGFWSLHEDEPIDPLSSSIWTLSYGLIIIFLIFNN